MKLLVCTIPEWNRLLKEGYARHAENGDEVVTMVHPDGSMVWSKVMVI